MNVFHFDPDTGALLGVSEADPDPMTPGHFLIPSDATVVPPPDEVAGHYRAFLDGAWVRVEIPIPPVDVDGNIRNAPAGLFGGSQLKDLFNGN